jgi:hypothetical protein
LSQTTRVSRNCGVEVESKRTPYLVILVFSILDRGHVYRRFVGKYFATFRQVLISSVENGIEHAFVEQEVTHPFGDDDIDLAVVHLLHGHLNFFHFTL